MSRRADLGFDANQSRRCIELTSSDVDSMQSCVKALTECRGIKQRNKQVRIPGSPRFMLYAGVVLPLLCGSSGAHCECPDG